MGIENVCEELKSKGLRDNLLLNILSPGFLLLNGTDYISKNYSDMKFIKKTIAYSTVFGTEIVLDLFRAGVIYGFYKLI